MNNYEKVKAWRAANKDKVVKQARRYRAKHPETNQKAKLKYRAQNIDIIRERDKLAQARYRKENPEKQRVRYENWRNRKEASLWEKAGRPRADECDVCHKVGITVFDHCHTKGHFRGWLCDRCNKVLGLLKDDSQLFRKLAEYLEKNN